MTSVPARNLRLSTLLAAALACVVLLPLLGHRSLAMWDEGIYVEISREMLHGNPLVPTWNLHPWLEKPPLLFWLTAAFFRIFGVSEFWARAVSAFSSVVTTAMLHRFLARRFGLLASWSSTVVLLSTFGYLHVCRAGEMDSLLALTETAAILGIVQVTEGRRNGWLLFWLAFAAAAMTKGAASVVLPLTLLACAASERAALLRFPRSFTAGLGIFLAAVLPWHLAMLTRFHSLFLVEYVGQHVLARASSQIEGHYTHPWYFLLVLLVSAPPWVLLFPSSFLAVWRRAELRSVRPLGLFAAVVLLFFTVVRTRLPHYIAPAYPALAAITGVYVALLVQRARARWPRTAPLAALACAAALLWAGSIALTAHARKELHSPRMSNGITTPDTHEPAALLKQVFHTPRPAASPLLLWTAPPIAPITTALFYAGRPVQQVDVTSSASDPAVYEYTWNPVPLLGQLGPEPRLILIERIELPQLPPGTQFTPIASSPHWTVGTINRRP